MKTSKSEHLNNQAAINEKLKLEIKNSKDMRQKRSLNEVELKNKQTKPKSGKKNAK